MTLVYFSPQWFFGYDIVLEIFFFIIALITSLLALRVYKLTNAQQAGLFSLSFMLISISYLIQSILNYLIISKLNESVCRIVKIQSVAQFDIIGFFAHIIFMTIGLAILVYMTLKVRKNSLLLLLIITNIGAIFYSKNSILMFFWLSSMYVGYLVLHFAVNYFKNRNFKSMTVVLAFMFLFFSNIHFLFTINHQLYYVIGHISEFIAYILFLTNFYLVLKR
ncbi:MAG: hypothetical protein KKF44_03920 [Nanoarchaeota archaeon]|nr:hypothetical protein [Nanoarchaeota archaeon]